MYNKLPVKERIELMKSYRKANKDMSYRDMVKDYNDSYEKFQDGGKKSFNDWYKTVPSNKADTSSYNLRRAYELAPQKDLDNFVKDPNAHLYSTYKNKETGIYEFMKSKNHPTIQKELEWFNSNDPEAIKFRKNYKLDTSKDYYQYVPQQHRYGGIQKFDNGGTKKPQTRTDVYTDKVLYDKAHKAEMDSIMAQGYKDIYKQTWRNLLNAKNESDAIKAADNFKNNYFQKADASPETKVLLNQQQRYPVDPEFMEGLIWKTTKKIPWDNVGVSTEDPPRLSPNLYPRVHNIYVNPKPKVVDKLIKTNTVIKSKPKENFKPKDMEMKGLWDISSEPDINPQLQEIPTGNYSKNSKPTSIDTELKRQWNFNNPSYKIIEYKNNTGKVINKEYYNYNNIPITPIIQKQKYGGIQQFDNGGKVPFMKNESDKIVAKEKMLASLKPRNYPTEKANYETQTRGANQTDGSGVAAGEMAYRAIKLADPTFVSNLAEVVKDAYMGNEQNGLNIFGAIPVPYIKGAGRIAKAARKWYYYDKAGDLTNKGLDIVQEIK